MSALPSATSAIATHLVRLTLLVSDRFRRPVRGARPPSPSGDGETTAAVIGRRRSPSPTMAWPAIMPRTRSCSSRRPRPSRATSRRSFDLTLRARRAHLPVRRPSSATATSRARPRAERFFTVPARGAARAPRRVDRTRSIRDDLERDLQRGAAPLDRRPLHADHRHRARALPLCRHPLVQHRVRPRRHHHRDAAAVARPGDRQGRAGVPGRQPGDGDTARGGRRAGQDPARDPAGRDGAPRRGAVRPVLRHGRRDAAVRHAGRACTSSAPATSTPSARSGRTSRRRCAGSTSTAIATATASSSTRLETERGLSNQGWKDSPGLRSSTPTASSPTAPIALCEVQGYVFAAKRHAARLATALGYRRPGRHAARRGGERCASASRRRSGARISAPTRWRSMATSSPAGCAPRTPGRSCSPASRRPRRAARVAERPDGPGLLLRLGHPHAWPTPEARYNPMSYHNGSVWPHDNALIALGFARYGLSDHIAAAVSGHVRRREPTWTCAACRSCSAASAAARQGADLLSGGLLAAGLGERRAVRLSAGLPRPELRSGRRAACAFASRGCRTSSTRS